MADLTKITVVLLTVCIILNCHASQPETGAKILVWGAVGSHSTRISMFPFMEALADAGHDVTFLSAFENFEDPDKKAKIKYFTPEKWKASMGNWEDHTRFFDVRKKGVSPQMWLDLHDMGVEACEALYTDPVFLEWAKTAKYDLVVIESAMNECAYGFVHLIKAKYIVYGTSTAFPWFPDAFGLPDETSTVIDVSYDFPIRKTGMTFLERLQNALTPIIFEIKREYFYFPKLEEITRSTLGLTTEQLPSFREIEKNISLVFMSSHPTIDLPRSLPPHVIPIGGAVASGKIAKPLSPEVKEFLDNAKSGAIYISFGTVAEFTNFDRSVQLEFINALYSFPKIKFLWKASVRINETLPKNVLLTAWAPQQTVLGHPNVKAFVTHCGMGSVTEAVHFGVPLVLIPVLAEQDANARIMEARGVGVKLEITTLKKPELEHAISEILNNKRYHSAMERISRAFRDRTSTPTETAVWWVNYILRHENSNDYLRPYSVNQPFWKRRQIDVWLVIAATLLLIPTAVVAILYISIKRLTCVAPSTKIIKLKAN